MRYYGDGTDPDLQLTDCPFAENEMGYLSILLEWHEQDPADIEEMERNDQVCSRWQGNRNPFVDFPALATQLYGIPQERPAVEGAGYATCQPLPPPPPPTSGGPTCCADLSPGAVQFVAVTSDNPDMIAMVALENLPEGMDLYLTDKAWMGESAGFRSYEGAVKMTVPLGGIVSGTVFGFGGDSNLLYNTAWSTLDGSMALSASGDSIIVYCLQDETVVDSYHFLTGLSYKSSTWDAADQSSSFYGSTRSALPAALLDTAIALPHYDNYLYQGSTYGTLAELKMALRTSSNWMGTNTRPSTYTPPTFTILTSN
mmetsp:Transcript_12040/g.17649  ORF Transcript_12040/g.17649 Transcript_12040/m.17649 type:complete len:313 (+) Transcript_12040:834-1772(+)